MPTLKLYHCPGACSHVALYALEAAGLKYDIELVDLRNGLQDNAHFTEVLVGNKIPTLEIDGEPLGECGAVVTFIHESNPGAGLLPQATTPLQRAANVGGFTFCGGTLHPLVRGIGNPKRYSLTDPQSVQERCIEHATKSFGYADRRIAEKTWWLGQQSVIDVYLNWAFTGATRGGLPAEKFPAVQDLRNRLNAQALYQKVQALEDGFRKKLWG